MILDRTDEMTAFVRAIEHGGFSRAAQALGVTPSAVSKTVSRLERRLGVRLLHRTTRSLGLTVEGEKFFVRAQRIVAEIDEAEQEVSSAQGAPRGLLRFHTGVAFGLHQFPAVLPEFRARYPEIQIALSISDRLVDLVEEGADLSVRAGRLADSTLVARKICDFERVLCAAPAYLKRRGTPKRPDDLAQHNCICLSEVTAASAWPFKDPGTPSGVRTIQVGGDLVANNAESVLQMALLGLGIIRLGDMVVGPHLAQGALVPLLVDDNFVEPLPIHAVMPAGKQRLPKVAVMVDFLIEKFGAAPWRLRPRERRARRARAARARQV